MKKTVFTVLLIFAILLMAKAQSNLSQQLPVDEKVSIGFLENGMKYYVRANNTPKNRAELFLVVKTGSVDEDDDQQGLAHFVEHMAFNGTANFPKNDLVKYFESIGMEFGPEINAYTSFDETVYMLKVPLDTAEFMDKGLQVLYDWASQLKNETEEIDKERGVITEEWRSGRGANERMLKKWLPVLMKDSRYAKRLPIGKIDIIKNFNPDVLRRYYKDWYRPDLQAVIVVGDFDQQAMVEKVKEKFSTIKARKKTRKKVDYDVPEHKETLVSIATDKEARYPMVQVIYKHPEFTINNLKDYRQSMVHSLYNSMISSRLSEKVQQANPPFIYAGSSFSSLFGPTDAYQTTVITDGAKIKEGLQAALLENERVKKYGFTQSELERKKTDMLNSFEKYYNERDKTKSINYANEYKGNFLKNNSPIPGIEKEFEYHKQLLPTITLDEVNALASKWMTDKNLVVIVTAPEKEEVKVPNEQEIKSILKEVEQTEVQPYEDAVSDEPLVANEPVAGKVVSEKQLEEVGATEWTLSNGAKVIFKSTDFKSDEIKFTAWSPGGYSLYPQSDDISSKYASSIMEMSGIGNFDAIALQKKLAGKVVSVRPYISELREGVNGSSTVKDFETMLQMTYSYFTAPRFDPNSYQSFMTRMSSILENKAASPEAVFGDTVRATMSNYHMRSRPETKETLQEANFERISEIAKERFADAADFTFFFVGNIDTKTFKPLVEKYIGGIPTVNKNEKWVDLNIDTPDGVIEKNVKRGQEPKSIQVITFHGDFDYNAANNIEINAMSKILSTRLLEVIREEKSEVYSISARGNWSKYPEQEYSVGIFYGLDPEKVETAKKEVFEVIKDFQQNGPTPEEVDKAKEKLQREREVALRENSYWLNTLSSTYYLHDGDFSKRGNYNQLVDDLDVAKLKTAFNKYFDFNNYISIVLKPEK